MLRFLLVVLRATQPTLEHEHHFVCATSGFNSVSNPHMLEFLDGAASGDLVKGFEVKEEKAMLMDVVGLAFKN